MKQDIELIPLLELPTLKDGTSHPPGSPLTNPLEWDKYQEAEIKKNYKNIGKPIKSGVYQYRLFDITKEDLIRIIELHISDIRIVDSCSLFGGYALSINMEFVLFPQCCGLLEEINDWKKILNENFNPFYLMECHPSPRFCKINNNVIIDCSDEDEPFFPKTQSRIVVDYNSLKTALEKLISNLKIFSKEMDKLSEEFHGERISNILIWGNK